MKIISDPLRAEDPPRSAILSIGNFDGVHVGHQAVLRHVVERAREVGATATAMTFDPHPVKVLRPREAPTLLSTLAQRLQIIERTGIEVALVVPFTPQFARMQAADFISEVLVNRLQVREVYIGRNFRFGADRQGDVELLVAKGEEHGFVAAAAPIVKLGDVVVSSTRVRKAVAEGEVEEAWQLLDRPVHADGLVLQGKRLGRKLGFPTLNVEVENELVPTRGVYVTAVHIPSFGRTFPSVTNVGVRPTVYENSNVTIESHLLDFTADVYDERVRLYFLKRLRAEREFQSPTQLMSQISKDVEQAQLWFLNHPIDNMNLYIP
ncbi:MAG: bifunctional riboflavin kinase/FAD synthetase [bacterium]|nr:bifunctional riboflavin kinase/FAD synthetase [bacterium]